MVAATVAIGFISLGVWAHHMFTVGMSRPANIFFVVSTMLVAVPTGIKIFNWLATMYGGKIRFASPMLFCIGFLFQFLIAGLTGIMLAVGAVRLPAHRLLLRGGALPLRADRRHRCSRIFAGILLLVSQGDRPDAERELGKWHFWLFCIGFHLTFDRMHVPGMLGMPRRIYTYDAGRGWEIWNLIVTIGASVQAPAILIFVFNLVVRCCKGKPAGNDPWDAWTLEWATSSPPPSYNFAIDPTVHSRRPLWDLKHPEDPDSNYE